MANKYTQKADGRFCTRVWDGTYGEDGKKHYKYMYSSKSSRDLELKVKEFEASIKEGLFVAESETTVLAYARQWLKTYKGFTEKNTRTMYNNVIETHLKDFNDLTFNYYTLSNIQALINAKSNKPRTCQQIKLTLKQIGEAAEMDRLLPKGKTKEIFSKVKLPKYKPAEKRPLTEAEKTAIKNAVLGSRERLFVSLIYFCGLRREEALALTYGDVRGGYISVNKAIGFEKNDAYVKAPKTARSKRKVPIPKQLQDVFDEYLDPEAPDDKYIITQLNGSMMTHSSYVKLWKSIQSKTGITATAHIFRHNYCTQLCYVAATKHTITTKKIAELLGDTEKMVLEVYSHIIEDKEQTEESITEAIAL